MLGKTAENYPVRLFL